MPQDQKHREEILNTYLQDQKDLHGILIMYLWMMIVTNSLLIGVVGAKGRWIPQEWNSFTIIALVGTALNLVCTIRILNWRRWGFDGFATIALISFICNLAILHIGYAATGFVGMAALYTLFHIGGDSSMWPCVSL